MAIVSFDHRQDRPFESKASADKILHAVLSKLEEFEIFDSVVLCGSYAKDDFVPYWSDIDLLIFYKGNIQDIISACSSISELSEWRFGVDLINHDLFKKTGYLGGRPLSMTVEVSKYSIALLGKNPISNLQWPDTHSKVVEIESNLLFRSSVHSLIRTILGGKVDANDKFSLEIISKSLLRSMMFISSQLPKTNFRKIDYFQSIESSASLGHLAPNFRFALEVRTLWPRLPDNMDVAHRELKDCAMRLYEELL